MAAVREVCERCGGTLGHARIIVGGQAFHAICPRQSDNGPEAIVARVLASWRTDEPALVGPHERKVAAEITAALRQADWRILK